MLAGAALPRCRGRAGLLRGDRRRARPARAQAAPDGLAAQQAAAAVGQGLLVHRYTEELARHDIVAGQVLLTLDDVTRRAHYRNAHQTFAKLLELGVLPIVNENDTVATTEIRFGDNDRLAALVAHLVHADLLVLLSDVDGLYDANPADPAQHPGRRGRRRRRPGRRTHRQDRRRRRSAPAGCGPRSRRPRIATGAGIPVVLTSAARAGEALAGEPVGTLFRADRSQAPDPPAVAGPRHRGPGRAPLDPGAVRAVVERDASLLAAGITGVTGQFVAGDAVDIADPDGRPSRAGWSTSTPPSCRRCSAARPRTSRPTSAATYVRAVVHRDDLVLL